MADFAELEARLRAAAYRLQEREHLRNKLDELDAQIAAADRRLASARAQAADEEHDAAALEGVTVTRVLASLRGNRYIDLDRERVEADTARLRAAEAQADLDVLRRERESVATAHAAPADARGEHAQALAAKEQWLTASGTGDGARLLAIATDLGTAQAQLREVHEAEQAADRALRALAAVEDALGNAHGWSTYDTFLGGGALSSMAKHNQMDKAREAAAHADEEMRALASEVTDVPGVKAALPGLQVDGTTRFLTVCFDNIFTDWSVRQRITEAQKNTARARGAVDSMRRVLHQRGAELETRLERLATERGALLGTGELSPDRPAPPPMASPHTGHTAEPPRSSDEPFPPWAAPAADRLGSLVVHRLPLGDRHHRVRHRWHDWRRVSRRSRPAADTGVREHRRRELDSHPAVRRRWQPDPRAEAGAGTVATKTAVAV